MINRPPVFANRCCKLVSDQLWILFGSATGFHRTFISLLEHGVRSPARRPRFRLAEHLGTPPSDIVRRVEAQAAGTGTPATAPPSP